MIRNKRNGIKRKEYLEIRWIKSSMRLILWRKAKKGEKKLSR